MVGCVRARATVPFATAVVVFVSLSGCQAGSGTARTSRKSRQVSVAELAGRASERRSDSPGEAEAYYRARRMPDDPGRDTGVAYRQAREALARLPIHSTRLERHAARRAGSLGREPEAATQGTDLATWEPLGPGNIGGRTRRVLIDPRDEEVLYAAAVSGGIWKTTDGGASWRTLTDELANITVNSLAMDPTDPDVLYAGTGEGYFREVVRGTGLPLRGGGIFRTADAGATWVHLPSTVGEDFQWVNDLIVSSRDGRRIYAATRTGVWRSDDSGGAWERVLAVTVSGGCLDLELRTDTLADVLFAACGTFERATIYRNLAAEGGGAWESVLSEVEMGRTSLAIAPSNQDVIYALAASNSPGPGGRYEQSLHAVFRSTAGGAAGTWTARVRNTSPSKINTLLLTNPVSAVLQECGFASANSWVPMGWYVNVLAVDPVNSNRVWAAGVDLFRSADGGASWGPASYWWNDRAEPSFMHADQHGITFHPGWNGTTNQTMYLGNDGGVYRTDNALAAVGGGTMSLCDPSLSQVQWTALNHGYGATQFYHGAPFAGGDWYIGGTQDNGTLLGNGAWGADGWLHILGGDGGYVAVDPANERTIYAEAQGFNFHKSTDGGVTFAPAVEGITDPPRTFLFITPFVLDRNDSRRLWSGGRRLWRSDDRAAMWRAASSLLGDGGRVSAVAVAPGQPQSVLAGTERGAIYRTDQALSATASTVWQAAQPRTGFLTWLAFDPYEDDVAYATYGGFGGSHVWRTVDGGATWSPLDGVGAGSLPDMPVHCVVPDPTRQGRLFLGTDLGVLVSSDRGASWAVENTGFSTVVTESLALADSPDGRPFLFAFTHGRGAWRVELGEGAPRVPRRRRGAS